MAENNIHERRLPPLPPPRTRRNGPPNEEIYEEVNTPFETESRSGRLYTNPNDYQESLNNRGGYQNDPYTELNQARRGEQYNYDYSYYIKPTFNEIMNKIERFKSGTKEFLDAFECTHDEMRADEETFIIVHLLKKNESNSPILNGNLDQLALLACCSSPHVVKRALDALLNEIFLSISDPSRIRCRNILNTEKILRESFLGFLKVDYLKAKCQRMTTYAWLITFVLLKCSEEELAEITPELKKIDKTLDVLLKENSERNTFRYGIHLAREGIKRIACGRKDANESLHCNIKKCENFLNGKIEKDEVVKLGKALNDGGSWLDLHLCLTFLQDLPKFHRFQGNLKPIILIQMLIEDFRERSRANKVKNMLKIPNHYWRFEILVYHVMLRLIRTSKNDGIIEQVLMGEQGCGGVFRSWAENRLKTTKDPLVIMNLQKLCKRAVFLATPYNFMNKHFITNNCIGNEEEFIEDLSILRILTINKDKVLEILPKSEVLVGKQRVITYDVLMSGKKCLLKLHQHSKEELLKTDAVKSVSLRKEIQIIRVLNAAPVSCPSIVQLLGSSIEAPMYMIIERGSKGDLLTYLKDLVDSTEAGTLLRIAQDICSAMIFLEGQNIIHRDLRAKNCFVFLQDEKLLVKLGDFHLAVLAYCDPKSPTNLKSRQNSVTSMVKVDVSSQFAVPWMAIEVLQVCEFSTASDVWSFGVLLFEIFTLGCQPYANMPSGRSLESDEEVREFVLSGNRLELHPKIPDSVKVLIQLTMVDPDHRPMFSELRDNLLGVNFEEEMYTDSAYFQISHGNETENICQPVNVGTGCIANGCFGDCLNASDVATPLDVDDDSAHFIKEFIPVSTHAILKLSELECPSLAIITNTIVHDEKVEVITEVGDLGSLEEFITEYGCPEENAMRYLSGIGDGVSFLHKRRYIHRNLCAKSVFIYSNGNVKLACFARVKKLKPNPDDQASTIPIILPMPKDSLRWSSPEVIKDGEYSKASDIWAFGVLIWEIFSLIDEEDNEGDDVASHLPYHQLTLKHEILSYLQRGKRLEKPKSCPDWLHEIMQECWEENTQERAKCEDIVQYMNDQICT